MNSDNDGGGCSASLGLVGLIILIWLFFSHMALKDRVLKLETEAPWLLKGK